MKDQTLRIQPRAPIFALATPLGGAIAIMRMSGEGVKAVLSDIFSGKVEHSKLSHGCITDGDTIIDEVMAVYFESPKSYTGEDMCEIHIHASFSIAETLSEMLLKRNICPAAPGEFTRRAFLNNKMDLVRAEAVMDLIHATAARSSTAALRQLSGELSCRISHITERLLNAAAFIEAAIDYPEEMEYEDSVKEDICEALNDINSLLKSGLLSRRIHDALAISITGKPNSGKSSLLNALTGEDKAIVSEIAGTTRDVIERDVRLNALSATLFDTAGLHDTNDEVERLGIARTLQTLDRSDLLLVVLDASRPFDAQDAKILEQTQKHQRILVINKCDLPMQLDATGIPRDERALFISAKRGDGLEALKNEIAARISPGFSDGLITNARHIKLLEEAKTALESSYQTTEVDCMITDIRDALKSLGQIVGRDVDDAVLDRIFERFCVGK